MMVVAYGYTNVLHVTVEWRRIMKLNKYLYKKFTQEHEEFVIPSKSWPFTEEDVEAWIAEWYKDIYSRDPPTWLCGKRWYDRRQQKIDEAKIDD
tara:strand:- start:1248 stop:1529 length:282 start_codon:yes stop_codon:yes gene_type:complete